MLILDTNIAIHFVRGESDVRTWMKSQRARDTQLALSSLSVTELLSYKDMPDEELLALERWITSSQILNVDFTVAYQAAQLRKEYGLKTIDSVIAATALVYRAPLASRDRAFRKVTELELIIP